MTRWIRRGGRGAIAVAALAAATTWGGAEARANGRFPAAQMLVPAPGDPSFLVMRATFGTLYSHDHGVTWDWVCEAAVGYGSNEDPSLGVVQSGTILLGAFEGLYSSPDGACTWAAKTGGIGDPVTDIVVSKSNPHAALVLTAAYLGQDDAGSTFTSKVWSTTDDGAHWAQVGQALDPDVLPETIEIAPSDASRVYVSGTRKDPTGKPEGVLLASKDGGATWTQSTFPLAAVERAPFIAAVDPSDPQRVYVRIKGTQGSRLVVSTDGAATVSTVTQLQGDMLGFALSQDGSTVFLGGPNDGLLAASKSDMQFAKRSSVQVQCLVVQGSILYACSNEASGFIVGSSSDQGATFTPLLHLCAVRGPLACGATSTVTTQCAANWAAQQEALGGPCAMDGGVLPAGDAGSSSGSGGSGGGSSGGGKSGGCALGPGAGGAGAIAGTLATVAAFVLSARRRRRRQ